MSLMGPLRSTYSDGSTNLTTEYLFMLLRIICARGLIASGLGLALLVRAALLLSLLNRHGVYGPRPAT